PGSPAAARLGNVFASSVTPAPCFAGGLGVAGGKACGLIGLSMSRLAAGRVGAAGPVVAAAAGALTREALAPGLVLSTRSTATLAVLVWVSVTVDKAPMASNPTAAASRTVRSLFDFASLGAV